MSWAVFFRILKDKKKSLIIYTVGSIAVIEMYISLFPEIQKQAAQLNQLLEAYPKGLMEAFGFEGSATALFSRVESYMSTEYFSFFWPIMVITMMIAFANLMIITEIERGTIELTLAQPVSRLKLFVSRYAAGVLYFAIFNFVSVFAIIPFATLHNVSYQIQNYFTVWGISFLFGLAVYSVATFFSALFSEKGAAVASSAALLLMMYVLNIVSTLKDSLENLKYFTFFHYFNPTQVFGNNEVIQYSVPVFIGVIIVFTAAAAWRFNTRDVAA